jgi:ketosteroid isomerase-like protein
MPGEIKRWAVEPLHRSRRGVDEQLLLALPWLGRGLLSVTVRAPAGSRLRRSVLTYSLRTALAAMNRGDYAAISAFGAPDLELHIYPDRPESRAPGMDAVHYGRQGYFKVLEGWKAPFSEHRFDVREFVDPGGDRVGARVEMVGRGVASGVEVRLTHFNVWQLERGLLRRNWLLASEAAMLAVLERTESLRRSLPPAL